MQGIWLSSACIKRKPGFHSVPIGGPTARWGSNLPVAAGLEQLLGDWEMMDIDAGAANNFVEILQKPERAYGKGKCEAHHTQNHDFSAKFEFSSTILL